MSRSHCPAWAGVKKKSQGHGPAGGCPTFLSQTTGKGIKLNDHANWKNLSVRGVQEKYMLKIRGSDKYTKEKKLSQSDSFVIEWVRERKKKHLAFWSLMQIHLFLLVFELELLSETYDVNHTLEV